MEIIYTGIILCAGLVQNVFQDTSMFHQLALYATKHMGPKTIFLSFVFHTSSSFDVVVLFEKGIQAIEA